MNSRLSAMPTSLRTRSDGAPRREGAQLTGYPGQGSIGVLHKKTQPLPEGRELGGVYQ